MVGKIILKQLYSTLRVFQDLLSVPLILKNTKRPFHTFFIYAQPAFEEGSVKSNAIKINPLNKLF